MQKREDKKSRAERLSKFAELIALWLKENELSVSMENVRRWFDLKYGKLPSEKAISELDDILRK